MKDDSMQANAELINAFSNLFSVLNDKVIVILAILIAVYLLIKNFFDNKSKRYYYDSMLKEKNREIEYLADENRRYREVYLPKVGISSEELNKISAISATKRDK